MREIRQLSSNVTRLQIWSVIRWSNTRKDPCPGAAYVGQLDDIDDEPLTDHLLRKMLNKTGFCHLFYADKLFPCNLPL